jgi:hypothetical protein
MTANLNSAHQGPLRLPLLTIGFCTDLAGEEKLKALGIERIWRRGDGSNTMDDALYDFRGRSGALAIVDDLRIFGLTRRDILAKVSEIAKDTCDHKPITVINIDQPDADIFALVNQALAALHAAAPIRNHRTARRRGSMGGKAKAAAAEMARAMLIHPEIARRLWSRKELTQKIKLWILGEGFTLSSCQRHLT